MKKLFSLVLVLMLAVTMFSACGEKAENAGEVAADTVAKEGTMVIGYTRMLRRALRRPDEAESPAKIARCKEMLGILLSKIDSLEF